MSTMSVTRTPIAARASAFASAGRSAVRRAVAPARGVATPRGRRGCVIVRADVWSEMSGYMKSQCEEAAALEAKDVEAGRAKWIEIDRQVPGARLAYQEHKGDGKNADALEKFCDDEPNAEECKGFDE